MHLVTALEPSEVVATVAASSAITRCSPNRSVAATV